MAGGAQALLFSSKNLVDWAMRYVSDFYLNIRSSDAQPPDAGQGTRNHDSRHLCLSYG